MVPTNQNPEAPDSGDSPDNRGFTTSDPEVDDSEVALEQEALFSVGKLAEILEHGSEAKKSMVMMSSMK